MAGAFADLRGRAGIALARERAVLLAAPAVAVLVAWAALRGGYPTIHWYSGALVFLALLVAAALGWSRGGQRLPRAAVVALVCLAGYTAWSFLSIAWADVRGEAWDGANRTLLYLTVFALFAILPWTVRGAHVVLGGYALGIAGLAAWTLGRAATSDRPLTYFAGGTRFSVPTGYHNANAALFAFAFLVLVHLVARRGAPVVVRAAAAAGAVVLTVLSLLAQSRGWLGAIVVGAVLLVAITPGRARVLLALLAVGAAVLPLVRRALDVSDAVAAREAGPALDAVANGTLAAAAAAGAFAVIWGLVDRSYRPSPTVGRVADRAVAGLMAGAVVVAVAVAFALDSPRERISDGWRDFTNVEEPAGGTGPYITSGVSGNRYDLWRVAFDAFRRQPVIGIGADNFAAEYFRERRAIEEPRHPHSLELRALSQTGLVGALLLAGFLVAAFAAAWAPRLGALATRGLRAAIVAGAAYWLVHGSIDWFWEIPGVSAPVFAALGLAAALPSAAVPGRTGPSVRRPVVAAGVVLAVAAALSYVLPLLSTLYVRAGARGWQADAPAAYAALDRARRLNPLSDRPDLIAGAIASRLDDHERMRRRFAAAVERNPHGWYGFLELGIAESLVGSREQALDHLAAAAELNPLEPLIPAVVEDVRAGRRVDPHEIDAVFLRRRFGSSPGEEAGGRP